MWGWQAGGQGYTRSVPLTNKAQMRALKTGSARGVVARFEGSGMACAAKRSSLGKTLGKCLTRALRLLTKR